MTSAGHEDLPLIDVRQPRPAAVYAYLLGAKGSFAADRRLGDDLVQAVPTIRQMAWQNREFMARATAFLARECGIIQFLDIGVGMPMAQNLHDIAQAIRPEARVVYVDNDPIVLSHARALMRDEANQIDYIEADLAEPARILKDRALRLTLDPKRPIGLTMIGVLMHVSDYDDPWGSARVLMDALPSGSYVAISHLGLDFEPEAMMQVRDFAAQAGMTVVPRTKDEVQRFFEGWELVDPELVPVSSWRLDDTRPDPDPAYYWAGVARKP